MADVAVGAVLQITVGGRIAGEGQQRAVRAVGKAALRAEFIEGLTQKQMVAIVEEQRFPVGQTFGALQCRDGRPGRDFRQGDDAGIGPAAADFFVDGKVPDMLLQHHKGQVGAVHELFHAAGRPVEEGLAVDFDEGFGADKAVFKKAAAPARHGQNQMEFGHTAAPFSGAQALSRAASILHSASITRARPVSMSTWGTQP